MKNDLIIIGAGGFGREVAWIASLRGMKVVGFCDDAPDKQHGSYGGFALFGSVETAVNALPAGTSFFVAVGSNSARRLLTARAVSCGWRNVSVIAPSALIAPDVTIGSGVFIGAGAVISVGGRVGDGVIINHQASVGHDVILCDYSQVCPCVGISGGCVIGEEALLGTNSSVIPLKKVGTGATLGAGSVAIRDIADGESIVRIR